MKFCPLGYFAELVTYRLKVVNAVEDAKGNVEAFAVEVAVKWSPMTLAFEYRGWYVWAVLSPYQGTTDVAA